MDQPHKLCIPVSAVSHPSHNYWVVDFGISNHMIDTSSHFTLHLLRLGKNNMIWLMVAKPQLLAKLY